MKCLLAVVAGTALVALSTPVAAGGPCTPGPGHADGRIRFGSLTRALKLNIRPRGSALDGDQLDVRLVGNYANVCKADVVVAHIEIDNGGS